MKAYSIFDKKAGTYSNPVFCVSQGVALRMLMDLVSDQRTSIAKYPSDFALYEVGSFDEVSGSLLPTTENGSIVPPKFIAEALDYVRDDSKSVQSD